jgi:hypothetical protein
MIQCKLAVPGISRHSQIRFEAYELLLNSISLGYLRISVKHIIALRAMAYYYVP